MNILPFTEKIQLSSIDPRKTGLLVVDMNVDFAHESGGMFVPSSAAIVPRIKKLLGACRAHGLSVIFAVHAHRKDGSDMGLTGRYREQIWDGKALVRGSPGVKLHPELQPQPSDIVFFKQRHNAFHGTELELILRERQLDAIMIAGTVTQVCCESTVRAAFFRDIVPIVVSDGVAALPLPDIGYGAFSAEEVQKFTLTKLGAVYAKLASADQLYDWMAHAATSH